MTKEGRYLFKKLNKIQIMSPSIICEEMGLSLEDLSVVLAEIWGQLPNPHIVSKGIRPDYTSRKYYYELADTRYYEDSNGKTKKAFNRGKVCGFETIKKVFGHQYFHPNIDQHFSTFAHDYNWATEVFKNRQITKNNTFVKSHYVWVELDRDTLSKSFEDAWLIANNFPHPKAMRFWHSGNTSIHIGVDSRIFGMPVDNERDVCGRGKLFYNLAHRICGDVRWNNGLTDPYFEDRTTVKGYYKWTFGENMPKGENGFMKGRQRLENTDPSIYNMNSLLRMPNSVHEKSGGKKIELTIDDLANYRLRSRKPQIEKKVKPHLLHWTFECYKKKEKPIKKGSGIKVDAKKALKMYHHFIPDFDLTENNKNGFVTGLFNPLYEDTNPSVSIDIDNAILHDFGTGESYNPSQFLTKFKNINIKKAKAQITKGDY